MNLNLKIDPTFDSDDALDSFLSEAQGLLLLFDSMQRYTY